MQVMDDAHGLFRVNLYEQIADLIEEKILEGDDPDYAEGIKLPSEQNLANSYGVSRNVIREAIKLLKERGLVEPHNGVGAYITSPDQKKVSAMMHRFAVMHDVKPDEIILNIGYKSDGIITRNEYSNDSNQNQRIEDRSLTVDERWDAYFAFHALIASCSENVTLEMLVMTLQDIIIGMIEKGSMVFSDVDDASCEHERILAALTSHDPELAEQRMKEHLEKSRYVTA